MRRIAQALQIPVECTRKLAISVMAVALSVLAGVVPGRIVMGHLDSKIREAHRQLDERASLAPLYESLKKEKTSLYALPGNTPSRPCGLFLDGPSEKTGPKPSGLSDALLKIRAISERSSMRHVDVSPELNGAAAGNAGPVAVNVSFSGKFENFRTFLVDISALPYVKNIAYLSIERTQNGRALDFKTKIMLAMD